MDPAFLSAIFHPFLEREVGPDSFSLTFAKEVLMPTVKEGICRNNPKATPMIPTVAKLMVDNFDTDGVQVVKDQIMPCMYKSLIQAPTKMVQEIMGQIAEVLCRITARFREEAIVDAVLSLYASTEVRLRVLAAFLIPFVRSTSRVMLAFRTLSLDNVPQVRVEVVKSLVNCNIDDEAVKYVLLAAAKDGTVQVAKTAASVFGQVCPRLIDEFGALLQRSDTLPSALKSIPPIVIENGFRAIIPYFSKAMEIDPEAVATVLVNIACLVSPEEHSLILEYAFALRYTTAVISHLADLANIISDRDAFLKLLDPSDVPKEGWRIRLDLLNETFKFIPVFKERLLNIVQIFTEDDVAVVRDASVDLWIELMKNLPAAVECARGLMFGSWHSKLVLCKIVGKTGDEYPILKEEIKVLARDKVSNVRFHIAKMLYEKDREQFDVLFADNDDPDILELKKGKGAEERLEETDP
jgi:hypothetical protein